MSGKVGSGRIRVDSGMVGLPPISIPELAVLAALAEAEATRPASAPQKIEMPEPVRDSLLAKGLAQVQPDGNRSAMGGFLKRSLLGDEVVRRAVEGNALKIEFLTGGLNEP